jgi:hypothetical protein
LLDFELVFLRANQLECPLGLVILLDELDLAA